MKLLIVTKGSEQIGMGHVMRMLALAETAGTQNIETTFWLNQDCPLTPPGYPIFTGRPGGNFDAVILDFPKIDTQFARSARSLGSQLVAFEPEEELYSYVDRAFAPNNGLGSRVQFQGSTTIYLGCDYALLRPEFYLFRDLTEVCRDCRHLLITMGGSDPLSFTEKSLLALSELNLPFSVKVILGPAMAAERRKALMNTDFIPGKQKIEFLVNPGNMAELMAQSDLVIFSGGTTRYELAYLGIPSIALCYTSQQAEKFIPYNKVTLISMGVGSQVTPPDLAGEISRVAGDYSLRNILAKNGKKTVDGKGTERVLAELF